MDASCASGSVARFVISPLSVLRIRFQVQVLFPNRSSSPPPLRKISDNLLAWEKISISSTCCLYHPQGRGNKGIPTKQLMFLSAHNAQGLFKGGLMGQLLYLFRSVIRLSIHTLCGFASHSHTGQFSFSAFPPSPSPSTIFCSLTFPWYISFAGVEFVTFHHGRRLLDEVPLLSPQFSSSHWTRWYIFQWHAVKWPEIMRSFSSPTLTPMQHGLLLHDRSPIAENFLLGGLAGFSATILTFPFDLLRTRFATQGLPHYTIVLTFSPPGHECSHTNPHLCNAAIYLALLLLLLYTCFPFIRIR